MTANQNIDIRIYHTLLVSEAGVWSPAFGDYDLDVVKQEAKDSYDEDTTTVIATGPDQEDINLAIADLNKQLDDMNVEITRGDSVKWSPRFCQIVTLNGKAIGYFEPCHWSNEYCLRDAADETVKYTRKQVGYRDWVKDVEVTRLDDMVEKVKTVLLQGEMPDQDFINKRQADRDAVEAQDKADQAEWDRVALIKENAERLLTKLEHAIAFLDEGTPISKGSLWHTDAQAVINQAKGIK